MREAGFRLLFFIDIDFRLMRSLISALAFLTLLLGGWTFIIEGYLQVRALAGQGISASAATRVAQIGFLRGDLWANAAQTSGSEAAAKRALSLSPARSGIWLLLASQLATGSSTQAGAALQMAYFAGGGKREEFEARLRAAAQSQALADKQIQDLVKVDIVAASRNIPEFASIAAGIYKAAPAFNRPILLKMLSDQDPVLGGRLGAMDPPR